MLPISGYIFPSESGKEAEKARRREGIEEIDVYSVFFLSWLLANTSSNSYFIIKRPLTVWYIKVTLKNNFSTVASFLFNS